MKSFDSGRFFKVSIVLFALGSLLSSAQDTVAPSKPKHNRYRFIDLGTFGGPDSIIPFGQRILMERGTVVGISETDMPDPFAPNPNSSPNFKVQNGFQWRNDRLIKLNGLYVNGASTAQAINERGTVVGDAQNGSIDPISGFPEINAVE
jgi:uncharacterized membrane protein